MSNKVADFAARIHSLPAVPQVVADIVLAMDNKNLSLDQLAKLIEREPSLASKTLRVANSPFFGMPSKVASIREAATLMGLRGLHSLVIASSIASLMRPNQAMTSLKNFWLHSIETALAAQVLAREARLCTGEAFLAGLLHDIGKLALASLEPQLTRDISAYSKAHGTGWTAAEQTLKAPPHAELGEALAQRWHFPSSLCRAIGEHVDEAGGGLGAVVHVADFLAQSYAVAMARQSHMDPLKEQAWRHLTPSHKTLLAAFAKIRSATDLACAFPD